MRSFGFVTFIVSTILCGHFTRASAASWTMTPCTQEAKAREAARATETNLFNQVRLYVPNISFISFQRTIDQIEWNEARGEFVSEVLGYNSTMGSVRVTVSCNVNQETGKTELRPEIAFESGN